MNITIYIRKIKKEKFFVKAEKEYMKRINKYGKLCFIECKSAEDISKHIKQEDQLVLIDDEEGNLISSESLAKEIAEMEVRGISKVSVVIGKELNTIYKRRDKTIFLAISRMSLSEEMLTVVILEQIYRAYKIISGETYHK